MRGLPFYLYLKEFRISLQYKLGTSLSTRSSRSTRYYHAFSVRKLIVLVIDVSSHGLQGAQLSQVEPGRNRASAITHGLSDFWKHDAGMFRKNVRTTLCFQIPRRYLLRPRRV